MKNWGNFYPSLYWSGSCSSHFCVTPCARVRPWVACAVPAPPGVFLPHTGTGTGTLPFLENRVLLSAERPRGRSTHPLKEVKEESTA